MKLLLLMFIMLSFSCAEKEIVKSEYFERINGAGVVAEKGYLFLGVKNNFIGVKSGEKKISNVNNFNYEIIITGGGSGQNIFNVYFLSNCEKETIRFGVSNESLSGFGSRNYSYVYSDNDVDEILISGYDMFSSFNKLVLSSQGNNVISTFINNIEVRHISVENHAACNNYLYAEILGGNVDNPMSLEIVEFEYIK